LTIPTPFSNLNLALQSVELVGVELVLGHAVFLELAQSVVVNLGFGDAPGAL